MKKEEVLNYITDAWERLKNNNDNALGDEDENRYWNAMLMVKKLIIDYGSDSEG